MNSCEIVSLVTALSCGIARCVPPEDLRLLTSILGQLASTLATITINEETLQAKMSPTPEVPEAPGSEVIEVRPMI